MSKTIRITDRRQYQRNAERVERNPHPRFREGEYRKARALERYVAEWTREEFREAGVAA